MKDIEIQIINAVFKSNTLVERIINSKDNFSAKIILDTLMYSELSITDKIDFCNELSDVHGYKTETKLILSIFNEFQNNSYDLFLVDECNEEGYSQASAIFKTYNDAIAYIKTRSDVYCYSDYYTLDLCKIDNPQNPEYSLLIRFNKDDKRPIVYFIEKYIYSNENKKIAVESLFGGETIDWNKGIDYIYHPGDVIYVQLANNRNYYAVLGDYGSISYLTYEDSSEFEQKLVFTPMDDQYRITQHPKYTMLYDTDDEFPKDFRYELLLELRDNLKYGMIDKLPMSIPYSDLNRVLKLNKLYNSYIITICVNNNDALNQVYDALSDANNSGRLLNNISMTKSSVDICKFNLEVFITVTASCMNEPSLNAIQNILYNINGIEKIEIDYLKTSEDNI